MISRQRTSGGPYRVLLAFPPKAGGTFLKLVLRAVLPKCCVMRGSITPEDQSLNSFNYPAWIAATRSKRYRSILGHIHLTPTERDGEMLKKLGISPVLMRRNIADSLLSMHEMVLRQENDPAFHEAKRNEMPQFGSAGPLTDYVHLPEDRQKDFLIYNFAPWFLKYYSSWDYVCRKTGLKVLVLTFDLFRAAEIETVARILQWVGMKDVEQSSLAQVCAFVRGKGPEARYWHGVSGRAKTFFDARHFAHLRKLMMPYDFADPSTFAEPDEALRANQRRSEEIEALAAKSTAEKSTCHLLTDNPEIAS